MKTELREFISSCSAVITAEVSLAVKSRVDFSGLYIEAYNARKIAEAWLNEIEKEK